MSADVANAIQAAEWNNMPEGTKESILTLLRAGETPVGIERRMRTTIDRDYPQLPAWKREQLACRYYLAAMHAKTNILEK